MHEILHAQHVEDPAHPLAGGVNLWGALRALLRAGPFDPAQGKGSPLYVNPVNMVNILTKILAEEQVLRSRLIAGGVAARHRPKFTRLWQGSPSAKL